MAVAAAAASTDGDTQPHKKRKEDDPSIKVITKYFSPLEKNVDRMLSPRKSNNLLDYFKKTSPTNEKIASLEVQAEGKIRNSSLENSSKALSKLKRKRGKINLNDALKDVKMLEGELVTDINNADNREVPNTLEEGSVSQSAFTLNVSTNKDEMLKMSIDPHCKTVTSQKGKGKRGIEGGTSKNNLKRPKKRKHKDEMDLSANVINEVEQKDSEKMVDDKQVASTSEPGSKGLMNVPDHDINPQEMPQLSGNTVTVSFEEFLKSQGENKIEQNPKAQMSDNSTDTDEVVRFQDAHQPALKKVTVLAQIHSVPPKSSSSQKIASIFLKRKAKETRRHSSPSAEGTEPMTHKRKSNVVIAEEELELAVLETMGSDISKSKCTPEERDQFMRAFKQPESDAVKAGAKKGLKEGREKPSKCKLESAERGDLSHQKPKSEMSRVDAGNDPFWNAGKNGIRNNTLKRKKMGPKTKEHDLNGNENKDDTNGQVKAKARSKVQSKSPQKNRGLRRNPRQKKSQEPICSTPEKSKISENVSHAIPMQTSTPKTCNKAFNENDLYKAEMITEPFDSNSPIRMKFTRIYTSERFMQQSTKQLSSTSSNISKAKKLVEKAKVLQHNRAARLIDETLQAPLRRSSRQQAMAEKKKLQNTEDSVIILDSSASHITVSGNVNNQKSLPSLNDVLGKKTETLKSAKKSDGKRKMFSLVKKTIRKPPDEVIAIFDESSEGGSENSQDDKQFKDKRDFLKRGLPETLKRQIAKKASAMEAYSAAISCFQTVVHVQQKDDASLMWKLMPPSCSVLTNLRKGNSEITDVTKLTFPLGEFTVLKAQPRRVGASMQSSRWQPAFSEAQTSFLLEEIQCSNTSFPVKQFFDLIVKKQAPPENKQVSRLETPSSATSTKVKNQKENKRKRKNEDPKSKRRKNMGKAETDVADPFSQVPHADTGKVIDRVDSDGTEEPKIITTEDPEFESQSSTSGFTNEDVLWTEKYQPQNSSELIGNTAAISKLHRWLCEWKKRADWETNRNQKEEKRDSQQESSDSLDFKGSASDSEEENVLCNTMLLVGPPGTGKTAAVYACAQELGFKIFEVNASCQRSGRQILSQLKEATQSHQVDKQGVHAHKPCFFNSHGSSKSPKKRSPRKEWSPRKHSPRKMGLEPALAPRTLANYFKISPKPRKKEEQAQGNNRGEKVQIKSVKRETEEESSKKSATSLILFEEVDIIFDEDVGFLSAIKTFMSTTKRPVILTTNDPSFSSVFDECFEEVIFSAPSLTNVASYLQVLCVAENLRTDLSDVSALLTANKCDIRQSILHLQFWAKSGGGYLKEKGHTKKTTQIPSNQEPASSNPNKSNHLVNIPKYSLGCTENSLGLTSIILPSEDLFSFLKNKITTQEEWNKLFDLLREFQRKDIDFIYNNLEILLPLPINILPEPIHMAHVTHKVTEISNSPSVVSDCLEAASPVKKGKQSKRCKKMTVLNDSDLFESELNYSGFITLSSDKPSPRVEEKGRFEPARTVTQSGGITAQASLPAFQCLTSLAEFVDHTSFSDCCFSKRARESSKSDDFIWTKGKVKNGLSDEFSMEPTDWWSSQSSVELKATLEALNFNKCFKSISEIMENSFDVGRSPGEDGVENVTLRVAEDRAHLYFGQAPANFSIHHNAQKRLELIKAVFSSGAPLNLSNKQASATEYLPVLRSICKSEKMKEQGKTKRRFLHYLEGIHLPKEILNNLANDFP